MNYKLSLAKPAAPQFPDVVFALIYQFPTAGRDLVRSMSDELIECQMTILRRISVGDFGCVLSIHAEYE